MNQCVLKVKPAKFVTVRSRGEEMFLCCIGRQTRGTVAQIFTRYSDNKIQMAFRFTYGPRSYSPMVDGDVLKLISWPHGESLSENYWFERMEGDSGDHYTLRSVMDRELYLSLPKTYGVQSIILGLSKQDESILVTDVEVQDS